MLAGLEDQYINLNSIVNLEGGKWSFSNRTVWDSERHQRTDVTYQQAFELSSNVGMAKLAVNHYYKQPEKFIAHLKRLKLDQPTGIDLVGESNPSIPNTTSKTWSSVALPWISFGYNIAISPLQTLTIYNAVANGGKMMKPYLVNAVMQDGKLIKEFKPTVVLDSICSKTTLDQLKTCLEGVVTSGTAKSLQNPFFSIAGKTGTAQVANGNKGYTEHIYQASFAGYFPADNPKYSCIVVIKNKPFAAKYYGGVVAGPVFKEIANKLFTVDAELYANYKHTVFTDSTNAVWKGSAKDFNTIAKQVKSKIVDTGKKGEWSTVHANRSQVQSDQWKVEYGTMPDLKGFGLKDALELLEKQQLQVIATGKGKVVGQSILPGTPVQRRQTVYLNLANPIE
jgi:cell division protein FtsI (penicillin-binding protein 3)